VRSEQLTVPSNVDVKNKWRYTTTPPHQSSISFPRFKEPSKNSKHRSCDKSKSHTEDLELLGATVRNSVTIASPLPVICSPLFKRREGVRPHYVQKTLTCITVQ